MIEDLFKIIGVLIIISFIIYVLMKTLRLHKDVVEGLTPAPTTTSSTGVATNASGYANAITLAAVQMQDTLLITKYRADYENVLIAMDGYISTVMLNTVLTIDTANPGSAANIALFNTINTLNSAKTSLSSVMSFVDAS